MKLTKKNSTQLLLLLSVWLIIGTVAWELFERVLTYFDVFISVSTEPIGFDLSVLSLYITPNPGTVVGAVAGFFFFRWL